MASHFNDVETFDTAPEYRPLGAWAYFGYSILFAIPILGLILLIVFSLSDANINRRNYARSHFIGLLFLLIFMAAFCIYLLLTGQFSAFVEALQSGQYPYQISL